MLSLFCSTAFSQTADEYTTKTAFMVKMTHFIHWPEEQTTNTENSFFTICLEGSRKYFSSLENWAISGLIKKKPVVLKYINNRLNNLGSCKILYITEHHNLENYLKIAEKNQFLTISDKPGNAHRGVMINFSQNKNNLGFEINLDAAKLLGFKINPRLLKLAKIVSKQEKE